MTRRSGSPTPTDPHPQAADARRPGLRQLLAAVHARRRVDPVHELLRRRLRRRDLGDPAGRNGDPRLSRRTATLLQRRRPGARPVPDGVHALARRRREDGDLRLVGRRIARATDLAARLQGWEPDWSPTGDRIAFASEVFMDRPAPSLYTVRPTAWVSRRSRIRRFRTRTCEPATPRTAGRSSSSPTGATATSAARPVRRPGLGRNAEAGAPAVRRVRSPLGNGADAAPDELGPVRDAALHGRRAAVRLRSGAGGRRSVRVTHS